MSGTISYALAAGSQLPQSTPTETAVTGSTTSTTSSSATATAQSTSTQPSASNSATVAAPESQDDSSASSSRKTSLTPAPAPAVNVWKKVAEPSAVSTSLDSISWPKPEESGIVIKRDVTSASKDKPPVARSSGKEKWVPYTPIVQSSAHGHKSKKRSHNTSGNHSQAINNQNGSGSANGGNNANFKQHYKSGDKKLSNGSASNQQSNGRSHQKQQQQSQQSQSAGQGGKSKKKELTNKDKLADGYSANGSFSDKAKSPQNKDKRFFHEGTSQSGGSGYKPPLQPSNGQFGGYNRRYPKNNFYVQPEQFMYNQQQMLAAAAAASASPLIPPNQYEITLGLVIAQLEYYLSVENLLKDLYLRKHMNSNGFVPLDVLGSFYRIRALTNEDMNLLIDACRWAPSVQVVGDKLRPKFNWQQWVLATDERADAGKDEDAPTSEEIQAAEAQLQSQAPSPGQFMAQPQTHSGSEMAANLKFNAAAAVPFVPKSEQ